MTSGAMSIVTSSIASRPATPVRATTSPVNEPVSTSVGAASATASWYVPAAGRRSTRLPSVETSSRVMSLDRVFTSVTTLPLPLLSVTLSYSSTAPSGPRTVILNVSSDASLGGPTSTLTWAAGSTARARRLLSDGSDEPGSSATGAGVPSSLL